MLKCTTEYVEALMRDTKRVCREAKKTLMAFGWSKREVRQMVLEYNLRSRSIPDVVDALTFADEICDAAKHRKISAARWREMVRQCKKERALVFCVATLAAELARNPTALR